MFSVWPKNQPKTTEIDFSRYFHFKSFPPLSHTHEPLTHALLCQAFTAPSSLHYAGTTHTDAPRSRSRWSPKLRRLTSITIAINASCDRDRADRRRLRSSKSARLRSRSRRSRTKRRSTLRVIAIAMSRSRSARLWSRSRRSRLRRSRSRSRSLWSRSHRENMLSFWVLFEFLGMNDIMCLFGSWENVRKCEQQVKNVFSMVFSRIQPNIRKYFPKIFLKCNQTHESIFFSGKYLFSGNTFTRTKRSLSGKHRKIGLVIKCQT